MMWKPYLSTLAVFLVIGGLWGMPTGAFEVGTVLTVTYINHATGASGPGQVVDGQLDCRAVSATQGDAVSLLLFGEAAGIACVTPSKNLSAPVLRRWARSLRAPG